MNFISSRNAFTLMELMVGITLIGILALGATSMNFNRLNSKQKLEIFTSSIITNFENVRNNALSGKGTLSGAILVIPSQWKIDYSKNGSGTIITNFSNDGTNWISNGTGTINFQGVNYISQIRCGELNESEGSYSVLSSSGTGSIIFEGAKLKLDINGDLTCSSTDRILELKVNNKLNTKIIKINTVNGIIETK